MHAPVHRPREGPALRVLPGESAWFFFLLFLPVLKYIACLPNSKVSKKSGLEVAPVSFSSSYLSSRQRGLLSLFGSACELTALCS